MYMFKKLVDLSLRAIDSQPSFDETTARSFNLQNTTIRVTSINYLHGI